MFPTVLGKDFNLILNYPISNEATCSDKVAEMSLGETDQHGEYCSTKSVVGSGSEVGPQKPNGAKAMDTPAYIRKAMSKPSSPSGSPESSNDLMTGQICGNRLRMGKHWIREKGRACLDSTRIKIRKRTQKEEGIC